MLTVLTALGAFAGLPACSPAPETLRTRCQAHMDQKDYAAAVASCGEALAARADPQVQLLLMRARFQSGDLDGALAEAQPLLAGPLAAAAWRIVGRVHERAGRADAAREAFEKALAQHLAENAAGEAAYDAHALAGSYWRAGEYRRALEALLRTQTEAQRAGDERMVGYAMLGVGTLLSQVGDPAGAERAFARAAGHLGALTPAERANLTIERGYVQYGSDRPEVARGHFLDALKTAREARNVRYERVALENLARVALRLDELEEAATHTAQAAALLTQDPDNHDTVFIRFLEGQLARRTGRWADARTALAAATAARPVPEMIWLIELEGGRVAAGEGQPAEAEAAFRRSIEAIEAMRRTIGVEELTRTFIGAKREPFEALFTLQAEAGRTRDAAETLERALARTFLDMFLTPPPPEPATADPATAEPATAGQATPPAIETAWNAAATRADQLRALLSSLTAASVATPHPLAETLATLGDRVVLAYYEAGETAWWVRFGGAGPGAHVALHKIARSPADLARDVDTLLARLDDPASALALGTSLELAAVLPPPGPRPLYFAPTGPLVRVPLGALRLKAGTAPLGAERAVLNVPSATALAAMLNAAPVDYGPPIVLGDARGDLPAAAYEARAVATRLGVEARLGAGAAVAALREGGGHPRVLHVATHAGNGPSGPFLALADERLGTGALLELHLDAELVVLASCASAAGQSSEMWGSLAATFLAGGARNVLATLRSVDDAVARQFVLAFYAAGGERRPAEAFATAQRVLAAAGPPSTWAHFVLMGTGEPAPPAAPPGGAVKPTGVTRP